MRAPQVVLRQETIDLDQPEPCSREYTVAPPDFAGATVIRILNADLTVVTDPVVQAPDRTERLLARNSVFSGDSFEIRVGTGANWFDPAALPSAVLTVSAPTASVRFVAIDPQTEARKREGSRDRGGFRRARRNGPPSA
jgi:hypothetical protein